MKKPSYILALVLAAALSFAWGYIAATDEVFPGKQVRALLAHSPAPSAHDAGESPGRSAAWREKASFFTTFGAHASVVMIGDSITDGAEWGEMFPGASIANRGIDGDTTDGVLERMDGILSVHAGKAFIMMGINDLAGAGRSVDDVFADYGRIVAALEKSGARVFIQSTLLCNEAMAAWISCAASTEKIRQLNVRLRGLASGSGSGNVVYIDINAVLAGNGGLKNDLSYDGVHLNGEGYRIWKNAIAPFLQPN